MLNLILPFIVIAGLYFIYRQISQLNTFIESIIEIARNNNSPNVLNDVVNSYDEFNNKSLLNPEYLMSKLMGGGDNQFNDIEGLKLKVDVAAETILQLDMLEKN